MGKRQLLVATSADEDDEPKLKADSKKLKADSKKQPDAEDAEEEKGDEEEEEVTPEEAPEDAKPVGDVIKFVRKGKKRRKHYNSFAYKGNVYEIEDPVLITPEDKQQMPYVAIIKNSVALSRRLLNKELDPVVIVNMSHNELKMTDARCSRCTEKVCDAEIIHAGDRYQLECMVCGYTWYASHDAISSLTIDTPSVSGNVGAAPWTTAKFEDVERKKLVRPRDSEKPDVDGSIHTSV